MPKMIGAFKLSGGNNDKVLLIQAGRLQQSLSKQVFNLKKKEFTDELKIQDLSFEIGWAIELKMNAKTKIHGVLANRFSRKSVYFLDFSNLSLGFQLLNNQGLLNSNGKSQF